MTLFADVVAASERVAETRSRSRKVAVLAELLRSLDPDEIAIATGILSGVPRQGRVGVGYSSVYGAEYVPAGEASLAIREVDAAVGALEEAVGPGSGAARREILLALLGRATEAEGRFLRRLLTGELRQGALAGVMVDAVAAAAEVPAAAARIRPSLRSRVGRRR
jgi:DNA ligase-1